MDTHVILVFVTIISCVSAINSACPAHIPHNENLLQFGSSCYEFILNHPGDWHQADYDCRSKSGHLVDIHSYSEQAFLYNSIQILGFHDDKGVWIGLSDFDGENNWHWVRSGTKLSFTNWAPGQPGSVGGLEDCALMLFADNGQWHDYPCDGFLFLSENHGWICEYGMVISEKLDNMV